jgi:hypothetical protein
MISCASTRKSVQTSCTTDTYIDKYDSQTTKKEKAIDTTKTESEKITITEIEFFQTPTVNIGNKTDTTKTAINVDGLTLANVGSIKNAAIKSIKQTTIEKGSEEKGKINESSESVKKQSTGISNKGNQTSVVQSSPAPDPYRWRYIFYILMLVGVAMLYLKRVPLFNWIKKILSGIRRVF